MAVRSIVAALVGLLASGSVHATEPSGQRPTYTDRNLGITPAAPIPNETAFERRFWVPGLDEGFVPQGLTVTEGALYISSYKSTDPKQGRGPCRLYRLDAVAGAVIGTLDLPPTCGHAGGLARGAKGRLWVSDTWTIYEVALAAPGEAGIGRVLREIRLTGSVKGSFSAGEPGALWLGSYERDGPGRLYRFDTATLKPVLTEADATRSLPLPSRAQGAAFDAQGRLWITRSGHTLGELLRLDTATGAVQATYQMPAGVEDLSFDAEGRLWTMSEAGSRRWFAWNTFYPVIFRLDPARLR